MTTIGAAAHRPIQPVSVNTLANSRTHGWPAGHSNWNPPHASTGSPASPANYGAVNNYNNADNHVPTQHNDGGNNYNYNTYNPHQNNNANHGHRPPFSQSAQPVNRSGETLPTSHPQNYGTPANSQTQPANGNGRWQN